MNKNEQNVIDQIRKGAEEIEVPDRLKPDQIRELLENRKQKKRFPISRIGVLAAACVVVVSGILLWTDQRMGQKNGDTGQNADSQISASKELAMAESYDQIYQYVKSYQDSMMTREAVTYDLGITEEASLDSSVSANGFGMKQEYGNSGDYSQTNVRQEGVDEGDIVKTDGIYLYVVEENGYVVDIVSVNGGNMEKCGSVTLEKECTIREIYLDTERKRMVLISEQDYMTADGGTVETEALTYDIADVAEPKEIGRMSQSGNYNTSRMANGYLYLFSTYYVNSPIVREDPSTYVPLINEKEMERSDICLPQVSQGCMYEVITSIDIANPDEICDSTAIFSKGGQTYVSNQNIYYYETQWEDSDRYTTTVRKFAYQDGKLEGKAQGSFAGYLNDTFSIDEYQGKLRVVTTDGDTNAVYVMNESLEITGAIEDLAKDERVYSARFIGDTGYFVTFRETDPLFSVDLSDPENPRIIGELKIPGFSEYLHFYGEDRLLGIGMAADENTGATEGVKLTMFDISDRTDVKEEATYVIEDAYGTDVAYDYKAVLADPQKNLIGFAAYGIRGEDYYLFTYEEETGFVCRLQEEINGNSSGGTRGLYIGDTLYVIRGNVIEAYDLANSKKSGDIIL
ncbi:beta-propeller domain-containing protein [Dorea sp. YH-dor226]|uniref:beta-propeller domain-containing protein n=1 Tax=Dorea sp. YH-dor226 TaxID=3151119 RepID=UPI003242FA9F